MAVPKSSKIFPLATAEPGSGSGFQEAAGAAAPRPGSSLCSHDGQGSGRCGRWSWSFRPVS